MRKIDRQTEPDFLKDNSEKWNLKWCKNYQEGKTWNWETVKGETVNKKIVELLKQDSKNYCSYCNGIFAPATHSNIEEPEIDHFVPKAVVCSLAYTWTNLFAVCHTCNSKRKLINYVQNVIKPDSENYSFEKYFYSNFDYTNKKIYIEPQNEIAKNTIEFLGLNKYNLPEIRFNKIDYYIKNKANIELNHFPFSVIIENLNLI